MTVGGDDSSTTYSGTFVDGSTQALAVTKVGTGVLTLSGANSHTGVTTISAGTIKAGNGAALGSTTGGTTVASGATLDVGGQNLGSEVVSIAGTGVGGDGAIVNTGAQQTNALRFVTLTANASVGGTSRWDVRGAGSQIDLAGYTLTKVGSNQFSVVTATVTNGDIDVYQGTLSVHAGSTIAGTGTITVASGATLDVGNFGTAITLSRPITLSGGTLTTSSSAGQTTVTSPIALAAATTSTFSSPSSSNLVLDGNLSGSGNVTKTGSYSVMLGGDNSGFTGTFTNTQSNVFFTSSTAGSAAAAWGISGSGNHLSLNASGITVALGSLSGTTGQISNAIGGASTFVIGALGTDTSFSGAIANSSGTLALVKTGTGTLTLNGGGSFVGGVTVRQGTLIGNANTAFGSGTITLGDGGTGSSNVAVLLSNSVDIANAVTVSSDGAGTATIGTSGAGLASNPTTFSGTITLHRATTFSSTVTDRLAINGQVTGNVGTLTVAGGGRTTLLSAANNFTGDIAITGSATILQASVSSAGEVIPNSSSVDVGSGATLQLAGSNGSTETIAALTGSGTVTRNIAGTQTLAIGSGNAGGTFSGIVQNGSGTIALNKIGNGVVSLTGANTYSGGTTISAGLLRADNTSGSATGSGTVTVNSGGTLGGTGTIGGAVTVNGSGRLSPGSDSQIAILTFSGNLTMNDSSSLYVQVEGTTSGTGHDQLVVAGSVTLRHLVQLLGINTVSLTDDDSVLVLKKTSIDAIAGRFANAASAAPENQLTLGGAVFLYDYADNVLGNGNDLSLTYDASPTPAARFKTKGITVTEDGGHVVVEVHLSVPASTTTSVQVTTSNGTATTDEYGPLNQIVIFEPGQSVASVAIPIGQNAAVNDLRTFTVGLSNPTNAVLGSSSLRVTLVDDEVSSGIASDNPNMIANGSFETPAVTRPELWDIYSSIPGWFLDVNSGPGFELQKGLFGAARSGGQYLELDGGSVSNPSITHGQINLYQDIVTVPGESYRLRYSLRARAGTPSNDNVLIAKVLSGDDLLAGRTDTASSTAVWDDLELRFTATSYTTRIWFGDGGAQNDSYGTFLDAVSVTRTILDTEISSTAMENSGNVRLEAPLGRYRCEAGIIASVCGQVKLVYNSNTADPHVAIATKVTIPPGTPLFSSAVVTLHFDGQTTSKTILPSESETSWIVGLSLPATNSPTGVHAYAVDVAYQWPSEAGLSPRTESTNGTVKIVNNIDSPYGAGWSLGGVPRLFDCCDGEHLLLTTGSGESYQFDQLPGGGYKSGEVAGRLDRDGAGYTFTSFGVTTTFDADGYATVLSAFTGNANKRLITYDSGRVATIADRDGTLAFIGTRTTARGRESCQHSVHANNCKSEF